MFFLPSLYLGLTLLSSMPQAHGLSPSEALRFASALETIKEYYVEDKKYSELVDAAIKGMITALDPHSEYLDTEAFQQLNNTLRGSQTQSVLGFLMDPHPDGFEIVACFEHSPASEGQLHPGDIITYVNGLKVKEHPQTAFNLLHDKKNNPITLTLNSETHGLRSVTLTRKNMDVSTTTAHLVAPHIGYIKIPYFTDKTTQEVEHTLESMTQQSPLTGLIIDLRYNPGGTLSGGVRTADLFLDASKLKNPLIVSVRSKSKDQNIESYATPGELAPELKIVILTNQGTASSAEVFAAALHDHHRAVLMGQTTFGKGSMQSVYPLTHKTGIKITTGRFTTPKGQIIEHVGIAPDIELKNVKKSLFSLHGEDPVLQEAVNYLEKNS